MQLRLGTLLLLLITFNAKAFEKKENSDLFYGNYTPNFIIRWAFQHLADHVFDPRTNEFMWPSDAKGLTFDPDEVKKGDIIFVRNVKKFFKKMHPSIAHPYIMVTAGEFRDQVREESIDYLDDSKIIAWFSIHPCTRTHPKFTALPLGIFQPRRHYREREQLAETFAAWRRAPKKRVLYMNFGDIRGQKPERADVIEHFEHAPYCYVGERIPFIDYMKQMSQFKFSLAPRGYGPDSYRVWEALLVGSIPIVRSSSLDGLYADLPVLIVKEWKDVNEQLLEQTYKEFSTKKFNIEKLHIEYWQKLIEQTRANFLQHNR